MRLVVAILFASLTALAQTPPPPPPTEAAQECADNLDCSERFRCVGHREIAKGQWSRGQCVPVASVARPQRIPYEGTEPPGYELRSRPNGVALGIGIGLFTAGTAMSVFWAAILRNPIALVPFIGAPLVVYALPPSAVSGAAFSVIGGVAQAAGIGVFIAGFAVPRRWLEAVPFAIAPTPNGAVISGAF